LVALRKADATPLPMFARLAKFRKSFSAAFKEAKSLRPKMIKNDPMMVVGALAGVGGLYGAYVYFTQPDYAAIKKDIAELLDNFDYDDGSYGPVLVRLAWHNAGTYSVFDKTGGSAGAAMRWAAEAGDDANAGLDVARGLLEPIKAKYPDVSYSDIWTLAGYTALEQMCPNENLKLNFVGGRKDYAEAKEGPVQGRLPDAARGPDHLRAVFYRMGFSDKEIVALSGAHALGRCHTDRSGFKGPWTYGPTTLSNEYFKLLFSEKWIPKKWDGPFQYENASDKTLMMLPTDYCLVEDPDFKKYAEMYAKDEDLFMKDFSKAWDKLQNNGFTC